MLSSPFSHKYFYLLLVLLSFSCASDKNNPLGLASNDISYTLVKGTERVYPATCSLVEKNGTYKLIIKGAHKSDGIIITVKNIKNLEPQILGFNTKVNVILNEKEGEDLNIYVSSGCKNNQGTMEIVKWDKNNKTITGTFSGPLCTRGIFAHLPGTEITEGAFYKMKYDVK